MPPETDFPLLNQIPAARLRELWTTLPGQLENLLQRPVRLASTDENAGRMALTLAMAGHALSEDGARIAGYFALSAGHLAAALAQRPPAEEGDHRGPYESELFLDVVGAFGDDTACRLCAGLRPDQLRWPEHAAHETQWLYLQQLQRILAGGRLDPAAAHEIAERCASAQASREDRRFVQPSVEGLAAVERTDERAWNVALAQLVEAHAEEATQGDFKFQPEGLVCMRALMLAGLGLDAGMDCRIDSPYLPIYLYDQD
jgi:hypothetical protein